MDVMKIVDLQIQLLESQLEIEQIAFDKIRLVQKWASKKLLTNQLERA
jgi:hypothetical protein